MGRSLLILIFLMGLMAQAEAQMPKSQELTLRPSRLAARIPPIWIDLLARQMKYAEDQSKTALRVTERNQRLVNDLANEPQQSNGDGKAPFTRDQANALYFKNLSHPVVGNAALSLYDTPDRRFGFCFGRAQWVAIELLRLGVRKENIKKIFAVGNMRDQDISWQFHVATMVRVDDGEWIAIDTELSRIATATEWVSQLERISTDGKLLFFVTEIDRLGASSTMKFGPAEFRNPFNDPNYNKYFEDMMADFRSQSQSKAAMQRTQCSRVFR